MELTTPAMTGQRICVERAGCVTRVTLNRPDRGNTIDPTQLAELHEALDQAEGDPGCRVVLLRNAGHVFCAGMDLAQAGEDGPDGGGRAFFGLLTRFTQTSRMVVSCVDGQVSGGGVGLAAASDFVFATPRSQFSLPEALWGLLPCCVLPFLIRRIGYQKAYAMTLATTPVPASEALRYHLADEIAEEPERLIRRLEFRATKLPATAVGDIKRYFARIRPPQPEMEDVAVGELSRLLSSPEVRRRITAFVTSRSLPWES